jgi:hypothetical protein
MTKDVLKMHAKSLIDMFKDQKALYGAEMARVLEPKTAIILGGLGQKKASAASAIPGHDKGSPGRKVTSNPPPPFRLWCARARSFSPWPFPGGCTRSFFLCSFPDARARAVVLWHFPDPFVAPPPPTRL